MYFTNTTNVNEAKKLYRELAFQFHPDLHNGEFEKYNELMKDINSEYQALLESLNGQTFFGTDNKEHTYYYNQDIEKEIAQKIQDLISLKMQDVKIWLIGSWVWVEGNTYPHKDQLKALKLRWHSKRKKWYYRIAQYKRSYSKKSFSQLKDMYGAKEYESESSIV